MQRPMILVRLKLAVLVGLLTLSSLLMLIAPKATAMSNEGPANNDMGNQPGDLMRYVLSTDDNPNINVRTTLIPIYYHNNTGTKTVQVIDGDVCTQPEHSAPSGGNLVDLNGGGILNSNVKIAGLYYVSSDSAVSGTTSFITAQMNNSNTCYKSVKNLNFDGPSTLKLDKTLNLYVAFFHAQINEGMVNVVNKYAIRLTDSTATVGYSQKNSDTTFAVSKDYPYSGFRDYSFPFAPDCTVTKSQVARAIVYDLDNADPAIQNGATLLLSIDESDGLTPAHTIPLQFYNSQGNAVAAGGNQNGYDLPHGSKLNVYAQMTVKVGAKYHLNLKHVYYLNNIGFQLPYDSIYYLFSFCSIVTFPPPPPPSPATHTYFQATGGDIVAGASIATDDYTNDNRVCGTTGTTPAHIQAAGIVSWNKGSPGYIGAGASYAGLALGYIQDFVTGQGNAGVPNSLTLSNALYGTPPSVNLAAGLYGGMFGSAPCVDYWSNRPPLTGATLVLPSGPFDILSRKKNPEFIIPFNPGLTIGNQVVPAGRQITLYIQGSVYINGNITYPLTQYSDRAQIPSFKLIVHGSIYIGKDVTQLDGTYVAVPDTTAAGDGTTGIVQNNYDRPIHGTIVTCSDNFSAYNPINASSNDMATLCAKQLVFNGSVIANQLWLLRNYGSLNLKQPAEIFNYTPESWLVPTTGGGVGGYQSIEGLPPVL